MVESSNTDVSSVILHLETLTNKYDQLLLKYKRAQAEYILFLKESSSTSQTNGGSNPSSYNTSSAPDYNINQTPCSGIEANDKGISQKCYDDIWKKAGCTTKAGDVTNDWPKQQTRDSLIADVYAWATMTDSVRRKGCYGDSNPSSYNTSSAPDYNINQTPCSGIEANDKGISQKCYDDIWKKAGCTTKAGDVTNDWPKQQTRDSLIADVYAWSTMTDSVRRKGCYGGSEPVRKFVRKNANNYKTATLLTNNRVDNIDKCEAVCAANPLCTGATYSTKGNMCFTYGGAETKDNDTSNGGKVRAWAWENSIIPAPTKKSMSENLTNLNDQLISLNDQILQAINTTQPAYKSQQDERAVQKQEITKNGEKLKKELDELKKIQKEHQELDEKDSVSKIVLTQNHYIYIAIFIISLIVFFMLFRFVFGSSGSPVAPQVATASGMY